MPAIHTIRITLSILRYDKGVQAFFHREFYGGVFDASIILVASTFSYKTLLEKANNYFNYNTFYHCLYHKTGVFVPAHTAYEL
jgi:hypothetical protein